MANELQRQESATMSVADLKTQVNIVNKVLNEIMIKDVHYGVVPGCGTKPALLKPGAEKIMATFRIGANYTVEDLSTTDERRYRVTAHGFYIPTGNPVGSGLGECSTCEKKFNWRKAICSKEYDNTDETRRQIYYQVGYKSGQIEEIQQIRTNPADLANTVLKMAKKRALSDLCLSATACSDIFTQDIFEDVEATATADEKPKTPRIDELKEQALKNQKPSGNCISDAQGKRLFAILSGKDSKHTQDEFRDYLNDKYGIAHTKDIDRADYDNIINWIEGKLV